mgnify:CR=1 FL=1
MILLSFCTALAGFVLVGALSSLRRRSTATDYLVAGRDVPPWLAALSSAATNNSGFMFIGLIGFAWSAGLQAVWFHVGWMLGDWLAWRHAHGRIRRLSGSTGALSLPALIAHQPDGSRSRGLAVAAGGLTTLFLAGYAAAQLKAGSTTLYALLGWSPSIGAVIGAALVVIYCFAGGIRASIWTDAAQSFVMIAAMGAIVTACWSTVGSPVALMEVLTAMDPALTAVRPQGVAPILPLWALGFVVGGFGAVAQPHIVVRTMALRSPDDIAETRRWYFAWFVPFSILALLAGLYSRAILPDLDTLALGANTTNAELALPLLASSLLPELAVGGVLAAIFAATLSTADSQVIACTASITQDLAPRWRSSYAAQKLATLTVGAVALVMALTAPEGVFGLVLVAWSALGATLGPLLALRLAGRHIPPRTGYAMMAAGLATVLVWHYTGLDRVVFKLVPGVAAASIVFAVARWSATATGPPRTPPDDTPPRRTNDA